MASPSNVKDYGSSLIRTLVPIGVGTVLTFLGRKYDVVIDEETSADTVAGLTGVVSGVYYAVVRWAEAWVAPKFGWLLGLAKEPAYPDETVK